MPCHEAAHRFARAVHCGKEGAFVLDTDTLSNAQTPVCPTTHDADLQMFLQHMPGGLFRYAADGDETLSYINQGLIDLFGYQDEEEFRRMTGNRFAGIVHPDDLDRVQAEIAEQAAVDATDEVTYRIRRKDGEIRWVENHGRLVADEEGRRWFHVSVLDITSKIKHQQELARSSERLRILADLANDIVFDIDCQNNEAEIFGDFESRFGRSAVANDFVFLKRCDDKCLLKSKTLKLHCHPSNRSGGCRADFDIAISDGEGKPIWCRYQSTIIHDENGTPIRHIGRLLDTHDQMMRAQEYRQRAERDGLTDVFNQQAAMEQIEQHIRDSADREPGALLFIDIDDFKLINDTYGHPIGDKVLQHLARYLKTSFRDGDVVSRFGGDEFLVFLPNMKDGTRLRQMAAQLEKDAFSEFCEVSAEGKRVRPTLSIGIVCVNDAEEGIDELYRKVDHALYEAKRKGKDQAFFE